MRMRTMVNYVIRRGGELILPQLTELAAKRSPCLEIRGGVYGIRELRLYASSHAQLHLSGHSGCFNCSSKYTGSGLERKYWFETITVKANGRFEVISTVQNVNSAVQVHTGTVAVEYNGLVTNDAIEMFTKYIQVDHDARFHSSGRAYGSGQGPGGSCGGVGGGAGHGGSGGHGAGCNCGIHHNYALGKLCFHHIILIPYQQHKHSSDTAILEERWHGRNLTLDEVPLRTQTASHLLP